MSALAALLFRPHRYFAGPSEVVSWFWPLAGFYLFGFASYFQTYLSPGYRMPYWLIVYIVAWAPAALLGALLFVVLVLLWYWPASKALGTGQALTHATKHVGLALLLPAAALLLVLVVIAVLDGNEIAEPVRAVVWTAQGLAGVWAVALVAVAAAVSNRLEARRTVLFVLWFAVLLGALGGLLASLIRGG